MPLSRLAWTIVVGICLLAAILLALGGYNGYAGVSIAVAVSAAINLL